MIGAQFWHGLVVGLFLGAAAGVVIAGLLAAARYGDHLAEQHGMGVPPYGRRIGDVPERRPDDDEPA